MKLCESLIFLFGPNMIIINIDTTCGTESGMPRGRTSSYLRGAPSLPLSWSSYGTQCSGFEGCTDLNLTLLDHLPAAKRVTSFPRPLVYTQNNIKKVRVVESLKE